MKTMTAFPLLAVLLVALSRAEELGPVRKVLRSMVNVPADVKTDAQRFRLLQDKVGTGIGGVSDEKLEEYIVAIEKAAEKYPAFLSEADVTKNQMEICAYTTIVNWETDFVYFVEGMCKDNKGANPNCDYIDKNVKYVEGKQYFGRGAKQLSWNYNYLAFSQSYFGDDRLLSTPELVFDNEELVWASSLYFWMSDGAGGTNYGGWCPPQGFGSGQWQFQVECTNNPNSQKCVDFKNTHYIQPGKSSPHDAIHKQASMPLVINVVNGGYDCCPTTSYGPLKVSRGHTRDRMSSYTMCLDYFGLAVDSTVVDAFDECPALSATDPVMCPSCSCLTCKKSGNEWSWPWKCDPSPCAQGPTAPPTTPVPTTSSPPTTPTTSPVTSGPPSTRPPTNPMKASCTGEKCEDEAHCRSQWGYCGSGPSYCNEKATWEKTCDSKETTRKPTVRPSPSESASPTAFRPNTKEPTPGDSTETKTEAPSRSNSGMSSKRFISASASLAVMVAFTLLF